VTLSALAWLAASGPALALGSSACVASGYEQPLPTYETATPVPFLDTVSPSVVPTASAGSSERRCKDWMYCPLVRTHAQTLVPLCDFADHDCLTCPDDHPFARGKTQLDGGLVPETILCCATEQCCPAGYVAARLAPNGACCPERATGGAWSIDANGMCRRCVDNCYSSSPSTGDRYGGGYNFK
jgi:hypothetical protein